MTTLGNINLLDDENFADRSIALPPADQPFVDSVARQDDPPVLEDPEGAELLAEATAVAIGDSPEPKEPDVHPMIKAARQTREEQDAGRRDQNRLIELQADRMMGKTLSDRDRLEWALLSPTDELVTDEDFADIGLFTKLEAGGTETFKLGTIETIGELFAIIEGLRGNDEASSRIREKIENSQSEFYEHNRIAFTFDIPTASQFAGFGIILGSERVARYMDALGIPQSFEVNLPAAGLKGLLGFETRVGEIAAQGGKAVAVGGFVGELLPSFMIPVVGQLGTVGRLGAMGLFLYMSSKAGGAMAIEYRESIEAEGGIWDPKDAAAYAATGFLIEMLSETIGATARLAIPTRMPGGGIRALLKKMPLANRVKIGNALFANDWIATKVLLKSAGFSFVEEGMEEGFAEFMGNVFARNGIWRIAKGYDEDRAYTQGVGTAALLGGLAGPAIRGLSVITATVKGNARTVPEIREIIERRETRWRAKNGKLPANVRRQQAAAKALGTFIGPLQAEEAVSLPTVTEALNEGSRAETLATINTMIDTEKDLDGNPLTTDQIAGLAGIKVALEAMPEPSEDVPATTQEPLPPPPLDAPLPIAEQGSVSTVEEREAALENFNAERASQGHTTKLKHVANPGKIRSAISKAVMAAIGVEIVYFQDVATTAERGGRSVAGFANTERFGRRVFVNAQAGALDAIKQTISHEVVHHLEKTGEYQKFVDTVMSFDSDGLRQAGISYSISLGNTEQDQHDRFLSTPEGQREAVARYVEDRALTRGFWRAITGKNPGMVQRFVAMADRILAAVGSEGASVRLQEVEAMRDLAKAALAQRGSLGLSEDAGGAQLNVRIDGTQNPSRADNTIVIVPPHPANAGWAEMVMAKLVDMEDEAAFERWLKDGDPFLSDDSAQGAFARWMMNGVAFNLRGLGESQLHIPEKGSFAAKVSKRAEEALGLEVVWVQSKIRLGMQDGFYQRIVMTTSMLEDESVFSTFFSHEVTHAMQETEAWTNFVEILRGEDDEKLDQMGLRYWMQINSMLSPPTSALDIDTYERWARSDRGLFEAVATYVEVYGSDPEQGPTFWDAVMAGEIDTIEVIVDQIDKHIEAWDVGDTFKGKHRDRILRVSRFIDDAMKEAKLHKTKRPDGSTKLNIIDDAESVVEFILADLEGIELISTPGVTPGMVGDELGVWFIPLHPSIGRSGGGVELDLELDTVEETIHIAALFTDVASRGKGAARRVMESLGQAADHFGVELTLDAFPFGDGRLSLNVLKDFYRSVGFEFKRDRDFGVRKVKIPTDLNVTQDVKAGTEKVSAGLISQMGAIADPDARGHFIPSPTGEGGVLVRIFATDKVMQISQLTTLPEENHHNGEARKVMQKIIDLADEAVIDIKLQAIPFGADPLPIEELKDFYRGVGFEFIGSSRRGVRTPTETRTPTQLNVATDAPIIRDALDDPKLERLAERLANRLVEGKLVTKSEARQWLENSGGKKIAADDELLKMVRGRGKGIRAVLTKTLKKGAKKEYAHSPPKINTKRQDKKLENSLFAMAKVGEVARLWYERSSRIILDLVQGDRVEAEKITQLIAIHSAQNPVPNNWNHAILSYYRWKAGLPLHGVTEGGERWWVGMTEEKSIRSEDLLVRGKDWEGRKTGNFYQNLMRIIDPNGKGSPKNFISVIDVHMMRSMGYPLTAPTTPQYTWGEDMVKRVMNRLNATLPEGEKPWEAHQVQAAVWTTQKAIRPGKRVSKEKLAELTDGLLPLPTKPLDDSFDFTHTAANNTGIVSIIAIPHETTGVLPELAGASEDIQRAFTAELIGTLLDPITGVDIVAEALGLLRGGTHITSLGMHHHVAGQNFDMVASQWASVRQGRRTVGKKRLKDLLTVKGMTVERAEDILRDIGRDTLEADFRIPLLSPETLRMWDAEITRAIQSSAELSDTINTLVRYVEDTLTDFQVSSDVRRAMNIYSAIVGQLTMQPEVIWHRPFFTTPKVPTKRESNGLGIATSREVTPEELDNLRAALTADFGRGGVEVVIDRGDLRLVSRSSVANGDFQRRGQKAVSEAFGDDVTVVTSLFAADIDGVRNDFSENAHGEDYQREIGLQGRPDIQRVYDDVISPRAATLRAKWRRDIDNGNIPGVTKLNVTEDGPSGPIRFRQAADTFGRVVEYGIRIASYIPSRDRSNSAAITAAIDLIISDAPNDIQRHRSHIERNVKNLLAAATDKNGKWNIQKRHAHIVMQRQRASDLAKNARKTVQGRLNKAIGLITHSLAADPTELLRMAEQEAETSKQRQEKILRGERAKLKKTLLAEREKVRLNKREVQLRRDSLYKTVKEVLSGKDQKKMLKELSRVTTDKQLRKAMDKVFKVLTEAERKAAKRRVAQALKGMAMTRLPPEYRAAMETLVNGIAMKRLSGTLREKLQVVREIIEADPTMEEMFPRQLRDQLARLEENESLDDMTTEELNLFADAIAAIRRSANEFDKVRVGAEKVRIQILAATIIDELSTTKETEVRDPDSSSYRKWVSGAETRLKPDTMATWQSGGENTFWQIMFKNLDNAHTEFYRQYQQAIDVLTSALHEANIDNERLAQTSKIFSPEVTRVKNTVRAITGAIGSGTRRIFGKGKETEAADPNARGDGRLPGGSVGTNALPPRSYTGESSVDAADGKLIVGGRQFDGTRWTANSTVKNRLEAIKTTVVPLVEITGPEAAHYYHQQMAAAKASNPFGAAVELKSPDDLAGMRLVMTEDGLAGAAVTTEGDIVAVFKSDGSKTKGVANNFVPLLIEMGGRRMDAFDTALPVIYGRLGMRVVARIPWSDEQAPEDWSKETFKEYNDGEPDVIFMVFDGDPSDVTASLTPKTTYKKDDGEMFANPETGFGEAADLQLLIARNHSRKHSSQERERRVGRAQIIEDGKGLLLDSGKRLRVTDMELAGLVNILEDIDSYERIVLRGVGLVYNDNRQGEQLTLTRNDVINIRDAVAPDIEILRQRLLDHVNGPIKQRMAEWSIERLGRDITKADTWWTRKRVRTTKASEQMTAENFSPESIRLLSLAKERGEDVTSPIIITDLMATYDLISRLTYGQTEISDAHVTARKMISRPDVRDVMRRTRGANNPAYWDKVLNQIAQDVTGRRAQQGWFARSISAATDAFAVSKLAVNATVVAYQVVSLVIATSEMRWRYIAPGGLFTLTHIGGQKHRAAVAEMGKYHPQLRARMEGTANAIMSEDPRASKRPVKRTKKEGAKDIVKGDVQLASDVLMSGIAWADRLAIIGIWEGAKRQAVEENPELDHDQQMQLAGDIAWRTVSRTQPMWGALYSSGFKAEARDNFLLKPLTMFMGQRNQIVNMGARSLMMYKRDPAMRWKASHDLFIMMVMSAMMINNIRMMSKAVRNNILGYGVDSDDDERDQQGFWSQQVTGGIETTLGIVLGGQAAASLMRAAARGLGANIDQGFDVTLSPLAELYQTLIGNMTKLLAFRTTKETLIAAKDAAKGFGSVVPELAPMVALWDWIERRWDERTED